MREQEFTAWLENWVTPNGGALTQGLINFYFNTVRDVAEAEDINLDDEFQNDGLASLFQTYKYTAQDERDNLPNPTNMEIPARLRGAIADIRSALNHYRRFCEAGDDFVYEAPDNNTSTDTDAGTTFGLEKDLQEAIRENITQLESGLEIIDNDLERKVASGYIDILAKDSQGRFVVIELKAGKAQDAVIAQILGYMGDIAQEENQPVRGIIVAADFNQRLRSTLHAAPNLELKSYRYTFDFKNET